ncbi:hypothetical protein BDV96DRAFT_568345 [Lophiotrema nucula]|uniref:D-xylose 1-dehydrogenase (NADP(+), D-xylono-1,5-lactone-forming) n=1 Tax=Lophiotrema nucula TaxID=690887 RepID=A0A6A5ZIM7_9PLEO|nr:hypothetical protein BDV96DRAFT_568345 [Lophiotrema nucula]
MAAGTFTLKWGILATGGIAKTFCKDLLIDPTTRNANDVRHKIVAAASSSSQARAQQFLTALGVNNAKAYGTYENLVKDDDVDIIYIATPHSHHYQNARLCLEAGKNVLIEKPITVNAQQAEILVQIAKEKGLFLMEAVWTRFFPLAKQIRELVASGKLGKVERVWADLSFWNDVEEEFGTGHRMVNLDLAGGALLDLGIYSLTWIFQILYHTLPPSQRSAPAIASTMSKYEATGCDEQTSILLSFPGGAQGVATTSIRVSHSSSSDVPPVRIQGTHGDIHVHAPIYRPTSYTLIPAQNEKRGKIASWEFKEVKEEVPGGGHGMFWEADECARCVRDGRVESEGMPWEETVSVMKVMDEVRRQGGLVYLGGLESLEYPLDV